MLGRVQCVLLVAGASPVRAPAPVLRVRLAHTLAQLEGDLDALVWSPPRLKHSPELAAALSRTVLGKDVEHEMDDHERVLACKAWLVGVPTKETRKAFLASSLVASKRVAAVGGAPAPAPAPPRECARTPQNEATMMLALLYMTGGDHQRLANMDVVDSDANEVRVEQDDAGNLRYVEVEGEGMGEEELARHAQQKKQAEENPRALVRGIVLEERRKRVAQQNNAPPAAQPQAQPQTGQQQTQAHGQCGGGCAEGSAEGSVNGLTAEGAWDGVTKQNFARGLWWAREAVRQGNPSAHKLVGMLLVQGRGVEQNVEGGLALLEAASAVLPLAQCMLAQCKLTGIGGEPDEQQALNLLAQATERGDAQAPFVLAQLQPQTDQGQQQSLELLRLASDRGHAGAMYELALRTLNGVGVQQNTEEFVRLVCNAAEFGLAEASFCLGDMHFHGSEGLTKDYRVAARHFEDARVQRHPNAIYNLAAMYYHGLGVPQSFERAFELYTEAAEMHSTSAWRALAEMHMNGKGVPKCEKTAKYLLEMAQRVENGEVQV